MTDPSGRRYHRTDDFSPAVPDGPYAKLDANGIHIITPPGGRIGERGTDHIISRERAEEFVRTLAWLLEMQPPATTGPPGPVRPTLTYDTDIQQVRIYAGNGRWPVLSEWVDEVTAAMTSEEGQA